MSNDEVYAAGLLRRALEPVTQPPAIAEFLREETARLRDLVGHGRRVVDFGCGMGRHLAALAPQLALGLGLDNQRGYIGAAIRSHIPGPVRFVVADARRVPCSPAVDLALCMTNTWGTLPDKLAVLAEMRRLAPDPGRRIVSVYSPMSVGARREWYARLGLEVTAENDEYLETADGFRSEHFTINRIRSLMGQCEIEPVADVGYLVLA
jgi:SAM-dependent methyltransferase